MLAERVKEWTQEWKEEGQQKGRPQGRQEGLAQILCLQLTEKFGVLSPEFEDKLNQADNEQLLQWSKRILTAKSLGDIFGH